MNKLSETINKIKPFINKKNILFAFLITISTIFFIRYVLMDGSLKRIEKHLVKIDNNIYGIHNTVSQLARNDSTMNNQLNHYPASQPLSMSNVTKVTSTYSERIDPITGVKKFHYGIDYPAKKDTPVYATGDGIVEECDYDDGYGNIIKINHKNGYESSYAHLNIMLVLKNQEVRRGEFIGTVGNTGRTTGYHLHYQIQFENKFLNPRIFYII
jgi:murein DD-endopeptidase MepM/ murein hydrolase activator NlpD